MDLDGGLPARARALGADYYGVADLSGARDFVLAQGGERVARFPRAVVMGIGLLDELVDMLADRQDAVGARLYRHHSYDVVNQALDQIALQVANTIQREGYRALPIPASKRASDELIAGVFSQKLAAHLAGIRDRGYALDDEENDPHTRCISAPVYGTNGGAIGCIGIDAPSVRLTAERIPEAAAAVMDAAGRLSAALGTRRT